MFAPRTVEQSGMPVLEPEQQPSFPVDLALCFLNISRIWDDLSGRGMMQAQECAEVLLSHSVQAVPLAQVAQHLHSCQACAEELLQMGRLYDSCVATCESVVSF
jgi:hypothetical protein